MFIRIDSETCNNPEVVSICDKDEQVKRYRFIAKGYICSSDETRLNILFHLTLFVKRK